VAPRDPAADPHFLHAARTLEALVSPPIEAPRALAWLSGETLLIAGKDGVIHHVEPAYGTRSLFLAAPDPAGLAVGRGMIAVLSRLGLLQMWTEEGALLWEDPTGLLASFHLQLWRGGVAVIGDDEQDRRVIVYDDRGERRARARVPARTGLGVDEEGGLILGRSTEAGLTVQPFGVPLAPGRPTAHQLRFAGNAVLGVATGGATIWHSPEAPPVNVKLLDVSCAALSPDRTLIGLGTRGGSVALAGAQPGGQRVNPARIAGHEGAVLAMAFAPKGRWVASAAARAWVWSY
jgi:hypothetical protein